MNFSKLLSFFGLLISITFFYVEAEPLCGFNANFERIVTEYQCYKDEIVFKETVEEKSPSRLQIFILWNFLFFFWFAVSFFLDFTERLGFMMPNYFYPVVANVLLLLLVSLELIIMIKRSNRESDIGGFAIVFSSIFTGGIFPLLIFSYLFEDRLFNYFRIDLGVRVPYPAG